MNVRANGARSSARPDTRASFTVSALVKRLAAALVFVIAIAAARAHADARADVQTAFEKVIAAGGFRAQASGHVFGPDLPSVTGWVDVVFPDRIRARTETMEFIATPEGAWVRALGMWVPTDRSLLPVAQFDARAMRSAIASIHDVHEQGRAKTATCAARAFSFRASGQLPGARAHGDVRVWICDANGEPARLEAVDESGGRLTLDFDWSRRPRVDPPTD